jgi:DNA repair exonuclease SbcCD nuclease subunit
MIAILGDTHFCARNASEEFHEYFFRFYTDFFDYIDQNNIKTIIQTGDLFDVRTNINTSILKLFREKFVAEIIKRGIVMYVVIGNHDMYYRESLHVNTPSLILKEWKSNFKVIEEPTEEVIDGNKFLLIPWVAKTNVDDIKKAVAKSKADYVVGHFEFNGFEMHKGSLAKTKHDHTEYKKFKRVISGHYHTKSEKDNVLYVGTPYELTWIDADDPKGFWTLQDGQFNFIENNHTIHAYVTYPDCPDVSKKYVRAYVSGESDRKKIDRWKDALSSWGAYDIKYTEKTEAQYVSVVNEQKILGTTEVIEQYIDDSDIELDKERLKSMMIGFYRKAIGNAD